MVGDLADHLILVLALPFYLGAVDNSRNKKVNLLITLFFDKKKICVKIKRLK